MILFIFALLIVGAPCLDISAAGTLDIQAEIGTSPSPHSNIDHWIPTSLIATQTTTLKSSRTTSDAAEIAAPGAKGDSVGKLATYWHHTPIIDHRALLPEPVRLWGFHPIHVQ